ncbi:PDR/VanB family oxidoreductase [Streptomyces sp. NBC_00083]|uniref:PDR/VanB family oxidoreductase n=1 Tax=Streptomyces sp. NBC_00083 TaxID=2975647 RepID=UPI00225273EF|nr:PDR/VanB family oxidoreductase [Streptomyces sp. NBC_00083]MCX5382830.1 PDR/VanB family oxidoreductase [Streptomyces sp. NBC_00083]
MRRATALALAAGTALLARRALRRRIATSPLWPMPALEEPVSGRGSRRSTVVLKLTVTERTEPAEGVVALRLEALDGAELPAWGPGAHLDLVLPSGLVRQYSLCGDPADRTSYTVATRLIEDGRGGSREVHEQLQEAVELAVRGPRNRFPLVADGPYVFVAGGIGITPILPMIRAAEAAGADWRLLYGGRSRATMPFLDELAGFGAKATVVPEDEHGLPDLAAFLANSPASAAVYCCGPDPLMDAVTAALGPGRPPHLERFAPGAATAGSGFEVELRRSGRTLAVPAERSLLSVLRAEVPGVSYSCEQGFCGTCQQRVLEGEIDHRDELLTDAERDDSMLICVSRCLGPKLVLDL